MFPTENPSGRIEAAFRRIHAERMACLPFCNSALAVSAVDFRQSGDDWRGALVTPWGISLLLLPAVAGWPVPPPHERAFRTYPAGTFAFLPNREDDIGVYLSCPLIHDMAQFVDHDTAVMTARASLIALDMASPDPRSDPGQPTSADRRRFLALGS